MSPEEKALGIVEREFYKVAGEALRLKEENKRLRDALEKVFDGSAFPGFLIVENPDRMTDILEYINETARQALKEE